MIYNFGLCYRWKLSITKLRIRIKYPLSLKVAIQQAVTNLGRHMLEGWKAMDRKPIYS